ncbi:MAG: molybdopterin-dependent oxidoreductase [Neomegalonema sp.]|nr:molybdopterin-dependent oxidoreductase [Neomegalonema sp.]
MNSKTKSPLRALTVTRRGFLGGSLGALTLSIALPHGRVMAKAAPEAPQAADLNAFLEIRSDNSILFRSPFMEGGQGVHTALVQILAEELDADPAVFAVETAPAGPDYSLTGGMRITGGSGTVRSSYEALRRLGASARSMLIEAAASAQGLSAEALSTEPGRVIDSASGRSWTYGELAPAASALEAPETVSLRAREDFRWIRKPVARLDMHDKSTGKAVYGIDLTVENMLYAAIQHAPRYGAQPAAITNEADAAQMPGVHSIHPLPGAVAVLADSWWRARRAVEALDVEWRVPEDATGRVLPADFSSQARKAALESADDDGIAHELEGDAAAALADAAQVISAVYDAPYLAHAQLEPPSALARWNEDGTLDLWTPNQAPDFFRAAAASVAGIDAKQIRLHSPLLGGFFGRHFQYNESNPFPQAILLAKAAGRPVKVLWSREEEFLMDAMRPLSLARMSWGLDEQGMPVAFSAVAPGEGTVERWFGRAEDSADTSILEGIAGKTYAIANRRVAHLPIKDPAAIGFWRSVGHSANDFFYECFFDEMAAAGGHDPYELRLRLLEHSPRHKTLLEAVGALSGGWKSGPFTAQDGTERARGVAMASPFGSEVATIAEVSLADGEAIVHDIWVAIDPGSIVNPAIVEAQVNSAVALGLSATLVEGAVFESGAPQARNFDGYPILPPDRMPRVHVRIIESGEAMGGIGEPPLPGVPPAVVNAVAVLTGQRIRSLPLSKTELSRRVQ